MDKKEHWENIYQTKGTEQLSWWQDKPLTSMEIISSLSLDRNARIIDVGGGDSTLVDQLLLKGYQNVTILDISGRALEKAKKRLGPRAKHITWVVSDIMGFSPKTTYDLWHDRATFHFLTSEAEIETYVEKAREAVRRYLVLGTFSEKGPETCSGLRVRRYSEQELSFRLGKSFKKLKCLTSDHLTPSGNSQNFLYCSFERKQT